MPAVSRKRPPLSTKSAPRMRIAAEQATGAYTVRHARSGIRRAGQLATAAQSHTWRVRNRRA
jgi:hypothetical protein